VPPIYFSGPIPLVHRRTILNSGAVIASHKTGRVILSDGALIAPRTQMLANKNASITLEKDVWIGAGVMIQAVPGKPIVIGYGSIAAAGAKISRSVPPMSVVAGADKIIRKITDADVYDIPEVLNDQKACSEIYVAAGREMASLSPAERTRRARELLGAMTTNRL
jgi:acetyltransferase-like isoleucine patch superfamily enzyme